MNVEHRITPRRETSNNEIARAAQALAPRVAPPVYKLAEFLIQNSTTPRRGSMFDVHSLLA